MIQYETLSIVENTSLFIIFGILTGTIFAPIIAYFDQIFGKHDAFTKTNFFLRTTWVLAGIFTLALFYLLLFYPSTASKSSNPALALAPIGMMIAALIASASVMKNIAETKANEAEKHKKEASKFHLDKCTEGLEHVYNLLSDKNNQHDKWQAAAKSLAIVLKLSNNMTEDHHRSFFELEKSKYCQKLFKLYADMDQFFFTGSSEWKHMTTNEHFMERLRVAGKPGYPKNIDPLSIRVIFSICTDSLHKQVADDPLFIWSKKHPSIGENELNFWKVHDILKHAVPLIEYFQNKDKQN